MEKEKIIIDYDTIVAAREGSMQALGYMKKWMVSQNRVDMGIALGNLKVANPGMQFTTTDSKTGKDGYTLMGKIRFS